jgi:uncharacterized protein (DUF983 family)
MQHAPIPAGAPGETVWTPKSRAESTPYAQTPLTTFLRRGLLCRCPACGLTRLFAGGFLRVAPVCAACGAKLGAVRADDAPPYFTVFIVAHLVIGMQIALERVAMLSVAAEMAIFLPATLLLTIGLIRPVKGATVGLMLKLGFAAADEDGAGPGHA